MTPRLIVLALALVVCAPAFAADYYVIVPFPGKTGHVPPAPEEVPPLSATLQPYDLPQGVVGLPYPGFDLHEVLQVTGDAAYDPANVVWGVASGALPSGIELGGDGRLSGTPAAATGGDGASFDVLASYKGQAGRQTYTIVVEGVTLEVTHIAAGEKHTCAVTTGGAALCWGINTHGQLGDGTTTSRTTPVAVSGLGSGVASVSVGKGNHTCAVTTAGAALCWGDNNLRQLGDGTTNQRATPVAVSGLGSGVARVSGGGSHTCAVTTAGAARCWGSNTNGQLGDGTTTSRTTPVAVSGLGSGVASVEAGFFHTCAVTTGGAARCWGSNGNGRLGDGTTVQRTTPVAVSGLGSGVASISGGGSHTCAVTTAGAARCWGNNASGQLGDGTTTNRVTPVTVSGLGSGVASVSAGSSIHTCAVTTGGAARCWGNNGSGRLGDGTTIQRTTPVAVSGLGSGVASVSGGGSHTCAVTTAGAARCWGSNNSGELGDGTTTQRTTPVAVLSP